MPWDEILLTGVHKVVIKVLDTMLVDMINYDIDDDMLLVMAVRPICFFITHTTFTGSHCGHG